MRIRYYRGKRNISAFFADPKKNYKIVMKL